MYDLHLYPGGAVRLHMLRCLLGDETFWAGVRLYVERFAEQVVETDDFRRVMEEVSGRSLGRFFDQWFHRAGYPHLSVDFEWDAESRRGTFMIEQKQAEPDGKDDAIFELEFELAWTAGGTTSARRVVLDRAKQSFAFAMDSDPEQVRVDPRHELVLKLDFAPGDRRLRAQLQAKDVVGRIQAAAESCKSGTAANVRAVRDACAAEGFWGVRVAMVRALAGAGTRASIDALIEVLAREEDPRVIEAGLRASLSIRDDALAVAVEGLLDDGLPYRASAAALEFLGAQREQAPVERLADAAASESYAGIVQAGALRGLAHSRSEDALEALLERSAEGRTSNRARPIAAESLGNLARLLERRPRERAVDRLVDLLRDPSHRVRGASVRGLDAARAREAVGALERHRTALAVQDQAIVDRVLRSIRGSHEPRIGALEKQLEEMRARVRKLDERMERLSAEMEDEEDEDEDDADDDDARD
jgi:aminopeptidase N